MESKIVVGPTSEYRELVCRLYGDVVGTQLADRYDHLLDPHRLWRTRLTLHAVCVYNHGQLVGHLLVQQPISGQNPFFGFIESGNDVQVATQLLEDSLRLLKPEQRSSVFAPVDLSLWHTHRFTISEEADLPFHLPQQPYYQKIFGPLFHDQLVYHTYRWNFPFDVKAPQFSPGITLREAKLHGTKNDWQIIYTITVEAFPSPVSAPSFEEFKELFSDEIQTPNTVMMIEERGVVAGYCFYRIDGQTLVAKTLAIRPQFQGKHIGRALYNSVVWKSAQQGCKHVLLLYLRSDKLIDTLRPTGSVALSTSILYTSPHL